jgi:hypothetical protein
VGDLPGFHYFAERGLLRREHHPFLADVVTSEATQGHGRLPAPPIAPAPLMGEHSDEIMREWLGLSPNQIEDLVAKGVVERASIEERSAIQQTLAAKTLRSEDA